MPFIGSESGSSAYTIDQINDEYVVCTVSIIAFIIVIVVGLLMYMWYSIKNYVPYDHGRHSITILTTFDETESDESDTIISIVDDPYMTLP